MISYTEEYSGTETTQITPNLVNNVSVVQKFITHADFIDGLVLRFATFNNTLRDGNIVISLQDEKSNVLYEKEIR